MRERESYRMEIENGRIRLKATSFKAEKGSFLHSGIFSRELAASFVAALATIVYLVSFALLSGLSMIHYIAGAIIFAVFFPLLRVYVFKEPYLETVIDSDSGSIEINLRKPLRSRSLRRPLGSVRDIKVRHVSFEPENPDAVAFVEKIALQHGTVIPGFGETMHFYNVEIVFDDATYTVLTTRSDTDAGDVAEKLREYLRV